MTTTRTSFLRQALALDAIASGALGAAMAVLPGPIARLLNLPQPLVLYVGLFFVGFALFLAALMRQSRPVPALVWLVIAGNAAWAIGSIAVLFTGWIAPNTIGIVAIAGQAVAVAVFAELEFIGQRRAEAAVA